VAKPFARLLEALSHVLQRHALLWFVLLGAVLFGVDALRRQPPPLHPPVTDDTTLARQWLEEEVLYREARQRGLGEGDLIVRRRLAQKMRALLETSVTVTPPEDATLQAFIDRQPARYGGVERIDLDHVFLSRGSRPPDLQAEAVRIAPLLTAPGGAGLAGLSDPHPAGVALRGAQFRDLERLFGTPLAHHLAALPEGGWQGPLTSALGLHFVRVRGRVLRQVDVEGVRQRALQDWLLAERARLTEVAVERLMNAHGAVVPAGPRND
jgi:peptidyl-prolyl cis-trans isomerase C